MGVSIINGVNAIWGKIAAFKRRISKRPVIESSTAEYRSRPDIETWFDIWSWLWTNIRVLLYYLKSYNHFTATFWRIFRKYFSIELYPNTTYNFVLKLILLWIIHICYCLLFTLQNKKTLHFNNTTKQAWNEICVKVHVKSRRGVGV